MPELPEVEVIRQGLRPHLKGLKIKKIHYSGKNLRTIVPLELMQDRLTGATIADIRRRAKYLLFPTNRKDLLIVHLGMTGKLGIFRQNTPRIRHDHVCFFLNNDMELRFNDTRRFGSVHFIPQYSQIDLENTFFSTSGPEPFSDICTPDYFKNKAKGSTQAVKTFIMNSKIIVGIGNIYANESLFAAKIHPLTPAGIVTHRQWQLLIEKIREILKWAIQCGGSTINDFISASGQSGYFQVNFKVYGLNNSPCVDCTTPLKKSVINGRASYFCPQCQNNTESSSSGKVR